MCSEDGFQSCDLPKISNSFIEFIKKNKWDFLNIILNIFNSIIPNIYDVNKVSCSDPKLRNKILFDRFPQLFFIIQLYLKHWVNKKIDTDWVFDETQMKMFIEEVKKAWVWNGVKIIDFNEKEIEDTSWFWKKRYTLDDIAVKDNKEEKWDIPVPNQEEKPKKEGWNIPNNTREEPPVEYKITTFPWIDFGVDHNTLWSVLASTNELYNQSWLDKLWISVEMVKWLTWLESQFDPKLNEWNWSWLCQITPILVRDISQRPEEYNEPFLKKILWFNPKGNYDKIRWKRFDLKTNLSICMVALHNRVQKDWNIPDSIFSNLPRYKDEVKRILENKNIPVDDEKLASMIVKIAYWKDQLAEQLKKQFIALSYYNAVWNSNNTSALRIKYAISILYISNYAKETLPKISKA